MYYVHNVMYCGYLYFLLVVHFLFVVFEIVYIVYEHVLNIQSGPV